MLEKTEQHFIEFIRLIQFLLSHLFDFDFDFQGFHFYDCLLCLKLIHLSSALSSPNPNAIPGKGVSSISLSQSTFFIRSACYLLDYPNILFVLIFTQFSNIDLQFNNSVFQFFIFLSCFLQSVMELMVFKRQCWIFFCLIFCY